MLVRRIIGQNLLLASPWLLFTALLGEAAFSGGTWMTEHSAIDLYATYTTEAVLAISKSQMFYTPKK